MDKKTVVLDNGVKLLMINTNKFKTVNVALFFEDELNDFNVTCDNLLLRLLVSKTKKHPSIKQFKSYLKDLYDMKIQKMNDNIGETFSFSINVDALNSRYTINNENLLEKQFEVLSEILYEPLVGEEGFENSYFKEIKSEYKQILINNENYKEYIVNKKVNKILGENNKLFILSNGYLEELDKISNKDVYEKYKSLKSLCKKIIVCGEINFDEIEAYANKYFTFEENRNTYNYIYYNENKKYKDYSYDSKFSQSSIAVLYDLDVYINDELYYPSVIFIEMFNYYLFKIVREEYNFCYSIYVVYMASRGLCCLRSNIDSKNYEMTLKLINDIVEKLKNDIDEKVFDICKDKIINNMKKEFDNPSKLIVKEQKRDIYNLNETDKLIEYFKSVTSEQIKIIANKIEKKFSVILKEGK